MHTAPFVLKTAQGIRVLSSSHAHERCRWSENKQAGSKENGYSPDVQFNFGSIWTKRCLCNVIKCLQWRPPTTTHRHPLNETQMFIKLLPRWGPVHICQAVFISNTAGGVRGPSGLLHSKWACWHVRSSTLDKGAHLGWRFLCRVREDLCLGEIEVHCRCFTGDVLTFKPGVMQGIVRNNFPSSVTWMAGGKKTHAEIQRSDMLLAWFSFPGLVPSLDQLQINK